MLASYIDGFSKTKVLCIGDIMLDRFHYGFIERISPEAPVPVFCEKREKQMLGGAGNVAANLAAMGANTRFIGIVGNDDYGREIAELLQASGCKASLLKVSGHSTIVKTRFIAGNNHVLRVDREEKLPIIESLLPRFKKVLEQAIKGVNVVLLSDYNKGVFTVETTPMIIDICRKNGVPVIVDPKGSDYSKYSGATLIKPNLKEFSQATGKTFNVASTDFEGQAKAAAEKLLSDCRVENIIVTLSEHGMIYISNKGEIVRIPTEAREVFDVSGAGDTSLAALGAALGGGVAVKEAMKLANTASGIAVGKLGTSVVSADELRNCVFDSGKIKHNKVLTESQAAKIKNQEDVMFFKMERYDFSILVSLMAKGNKKLMVGFVPRHETAKREITQLLSSLDFVDYVVPMKKG